MNHPGDLLSALLDGELTTEERLRLSAHLEGCRECRIELGAIGAARTALRSLPVLEPPPGLLPAPARGPRRMLRPGWAWAAAGIAAAALAVGLTLGTGASPPQMNLDDLAGQHTARVLLQPGVQTVRAVTEGP